MRSGNLRVAVSGREVVLEGGEPAVVGRDRASRIQVDDRRVARHHAVLRRDEEGWVLLDAGSRTGTFHDGRRVGRLPITAVVRVRLGDPERGPLLELTPVPTVPLTAGDRGRAPTIAAPLPVEEILASEAQTPPRAHPGGTDELGSVSAVHQARRLVRIGRDPDNEIVIDDLLVSRHHAELHGDPAGGYELVDLRSDNGTFLNGRRVRKARLGEGDIVGVGHRVFRLAGRELEEYVDTGEITFEAVDLSVVIEGRTLVDDVSFSLRERSLVAIVGPSGSGKSSLLGALSGIRPARRGALFYGGRDLYAGYDELRHRIGLVPQEDVLHRELSLGRALEYSTRLRFPADVPRDARQARVDEVLAELGLAAQAGVRIDRLSGGQRRRASVAIELLTKPSLLFLDEPTSGLDPGYERTLMELLRSLADGGRTVVVVTHSIQSLHLCDRVLVLAPGGRPAYFGPPQLAPAYFGHDDLQRVFQDLSSASVDWAARFRAHPDHARFVGGAVARRGTDEGVEGEAAAVPLMRSSSRRQLTTLSRRYVESLASDRRSLALLLLQAPVLGLIMLAALPAGQLDPPDDGELRLAAKGGLVLLTVVMGATWLGASNAVREIVKELPIFRRERAAGLSIPAYLGSKALVLSGITIVQAVVLVSIATARQGGPLDAVLLGLPFVELLLAVSLAGVAAVALGLLVSSLASRIDRAMAVLPVLLIVELILAMGSVFPEVVERPGLRQISLLASTQWGFAASASTAGLNELEPLNSLARDVPSIDLDAPDAAGARLAEALRGNPRWEHEPGAWLFAIAVLGALTLAALVGAGLALRRRDPRRL